MTEKKSAAPETDGGVDGGAGDRAGRIDAPHRRESRDPGGWCPKCEGWWPPDLICEAEEAEG